MKFTIFAKMLQKFRFSHGGRGGGGSVSNGVVLGGTCWLDLENFSIGVVLGHTNWTPPPPMYHTEMFPIPQCFFGTIAVLPQFCLERLKFMFMCKRGIFESRPSLGSLPEGAWGSTKPRTAIRRRSVRADCLCHA